MVKTGSVSEILSLNDVLLCSSITKDLLSYDRGRSVMNRASNLKTRLCK